MRLDGDKLHIRKNFSYFRNMFRSVIDAATSGCAVHKATVNYEHDDDCNKCGYGGYVAVNGHKLQGVFKNDVKHGYFESLCPANGQCKGEAKEGKLDGNVTVYK